VNHAKEPIGLLETEQQRIESRQADLVVRELDQQTGQKVILHVEIQNTNDSHMPLRMLRYYTDIQLAYPQERIRQYLLYIGRPRLTIPTTLDAGDFVYRYQVLDMHTIDCQQLLTQDTPDALVLAVLCDFKTRPTQDVVNYIVKRLHELLGDDEKGFREYFEMMETLSLNRNLKPNFDEAKQMLTKIDMRELPSFHWGLSQGLAEGEVKGEARGRAEGEVKGRIKGRAEGHEEVAIKLLSIMNDQSIADCTSLSIERVRELRALHTE